MEKTNCTINYNNDGMILDVIPDYDIQYRDLCNQGIIERPVNTIRAYLTNNGRLKSKGYRFTRRDNKSQYFVSKIA